MSETTPSTAKCTEHDAMRAWARLVNEGKAPVYEPAGVPVRDVRLALKIH
jgi:hypothetical protein